MNNISVPVRFVRVAAITAAFMAGSVAPTSAIDIDRYGNAHVTPQDMQDASNAQSRADAASWQRRLRENAERNSGVVNERVMSESEKQEAYRKAVRQSIYDETVAANARYDASMRRWAAEREAKEAARKAEIAAAERWRLELLEKYPNEQKHIAAVILAAEREKVSPARKDEDINTDVVAAFAEGLIIGSLRGFSLADLHVTLTPRERYAMALKLYGDTNFYREAHGHVRNHETERGHDSEAFTPDLIAPAALLLGGHGDYVLRNSRGYGNLVIPSAALTITATLAVALAMPDSDLDAAQRQQALDLLAGLMPRLELKGSSGAALAAVLVAAAQKNPELGRVKNLQNQWVPLVRDSIWAQGFRTMEVPSTELKSVDLSQIRISYWNLASMLVLTRAAETPLIHFESIRSYRGEAKLSPASGVEKEMVQRALQDWFTRSGISPGVQRAIQADCDQACDAEVATLAEAIRWDVNTPSIYSNEAFDLADRDATMKQLFDPVSLHLAGAASFLAASPTRRALTNQLLVDACADVPDRSRRALTALFHLTNIDDAISFPSIPKSRWAELVTLGEGYALTKVPAWSEPEVSARLARIRCERLGDEAGARRWIAEPTHQPKDTASAEQWQAWANVGGRAALIVAVQRHPEYFKTPLLLNQRLSLFARAGSDPEVRAVLKTLLANCNEVTDPATVLLIAELRGSLLGDWAKLGAWLDDPRRRPKDANDPLYPLYLAALVERDLVAGSLTGIAFGPRENAEACAEFQRWLEAVLVATGKERKRLIDENFPGIIYCPDTDNPYPDLRMLGYDIERGGFASRALLLLSSEEFDPTPKLMSGYAIIDGEDGKPERIGGPDVEPWLAAVAKLPRTTTPEALLAEVSAGVKARHAYLHAPASAPREPDAPVTEEDVRLMEQDRRMRWVADGCQDALVRLASRWSPARAAAQAALLDLGDQVLLDDEGKVKANPACIAARIAWEQAKMKGLDDAAAFATATATFPRTELKTLAALAKAETRPQPLLLWNDGHFAREAVAAAGE